MARHDLATKGAWVELRDVEDLRARDRKKVDAIISAQITVDLEGNVTAGPDLVTAIKDATPDAVAAALVSSWEIPYLPDAQLPRLDVDILGELLLADYDLLLELTQPAMAILMPGGSKDVDDYADPTSPSEPANG